MSADIEKVGPQDGLAVTQQLQQHIDSEKADSDGFPEKVLDEDKDEKKESKDEEKIGGFSAYLVSLQIIDCGIRLC